MISTMRRGRTARAGGLILGVLAPIALFVIGVVLAVRQGDLLEQSRRIAGGTAAPATIISVEPTERTGHRSRRYFGVRVTFTFEHQGQLVRGSRYSVDASEFRGPNQRDRFIQKLVSRNPTTAYFDPRQPDAAVLDPSVPSRMWVLFLFSIAACCGGLGWLISIRRARHLHADLPINTRPIDAGFEVRPTSTRGTGVVTLSVVTMSLVGAGGGIILESAARFDVIWVYVLAAAMAAAWIIATIAALRITPPTAGSIQLDDDRAELRLRPVFGRGAGTAYAYESIRDVRALFTPLKGNPKPYTASARFTLEIELEPGALPIDAPPAATPINVGFGLGEILRLDRFHFTRDNMLELVTWLREQLALDPAPERWFRRTDEPPRDLAEDDTEPTPSPTPAPRRNA